MRLSAHPAPLPAALAYLLLPPCLLLAGAPLAAQSLASEPLPQAAMSAVEEIDRVAVRAAELLLDHVPDTAGATLWLLPFLTDTGVVTRLGHRLQSAVHLRLLDHYRLTAVQAVAVLPPRPAGVAAEDVRRTAGAGDALAIEIQPFRATIRIVLRLSHAGKLRAGDRIDLDAGPELRELLDRAGDRPADPREVTDPATPASRRLIDPYEPDDDPGFEVIVDLAAMTEFERALTRGDRDRFAFLVREATSVTVETVTEVDVQLLLYRKGDHFPFFASGAGFDGSGSRLELNLEAGWYVAELVGFSDRTTGDYRIVIGHRGSVIVPGAGALIPLPPTISPDQPQTRYTTGGEDWIELQVPAPGFYLLAARSFGAPLAMALHHDRAAPPVAHAANVGPETAPGGVERALALFAGRRVVHVRIDTGAQQQAAYHLSLTPLSAPRRFADAASFAIDLDRGVGFHTLRIFSAGIYAASIRDRLGGWTMRVFGVPDMDPITARPDSAVPGTIAYELAAGDYLVELAVPDRGEQMWVCWTTADAALRCGG